MGDIKKIKKKYSKPNHPWRRERIEEQNQINKEFGIPHKTELWKAISKLESFKNQAKKYAAVSTKQSEFEKKNLLLKLQSYNLVKPGDSTDVILSLTLKDLLNRRLQTIVFNKKLARTNRQARQMITHRHILVNGRIITSPSYLVKLSEEGSISISEKSPFFGADHPEKVNDEYLKNKMQKSSEKPIKKGRKNEQRR